MLRREIEMRYIDTEVQLADIFTKPLYSSRFADLQGDWCAKTIWRLGDAVCGLHSAQGDEEHIFLD
jgi:hypothetical protein